jgi:DNA-binding winged helix-turn-helix (wHTH) protein
MAAESSIRESNLHTVPAPAGAELDAGPVVYRFGDFVLDVRAAEVTRGGERVELRPCTFHLLAYLVANAGRVVSRDELFDRIWPDVSVSDGALTQSIWEVRRALGEAGREQHFIRTVRGSGYCFSALVHVEQPVDEPGGGAEVTQTRARLRPSSADRPASSERASTPTSVAELSRVLRRRVRSASGVEQIGTLLAASDDLIAVAQRLGLTEVEVDARLARAACLLVEADSGEASADAPRTQRPAQVALR